MFPPFPKNLSPRPHPKSGSNPLFGTLTAAVERWQKAGRGGRGSAEPSTDARGLVGVGKRFLDQTRCARAICFLLGCSRCHEGVLHVPVSNRTNRYHEDCRCSHETTIERQRKLSQL